MSAGGQKTDDKQGEKKSKQKTAEQIIAATALGLARGKQNYRLCSGDRPCFLSEAGCHLGDSWGKKLVDVWVYSEGTICLRCSLKALF